MSLGALLYPKEFANFQNISQAEQAKYLELNKLMYIFSVWKLEDKSRKCKGYKFIFGQYLKAQSENVLESHENKSYEIEGICQSINFLKELFIEQ